QAGRYLSARLVSPLVCREASIPKSPSRWQLRPQCQELQELDGRHLHRWAHQTWLLPSSPTTYLATTHFLRFPSHTARRGKSSGTVVRNRTVPRRSVPQLAKFSGALCIVFILHGAEYRHGLDAGLDDLLGQHLRIRPAPAPVHCKIALRGSVGDQHPFSCAIGT